MASGNESPRQKMIGMMYLVLTAILALNISRDILDAFVRINQSLETTAESSMIKNQLLYAEFDKAKSIDAEKVGPYWEKAQQAKIACEKTYRYIETLKIELISKTEKLAIATADTIAGEKIENNDNYDIPTHILFGSSEDGSGGEARFLKEKLDSCRNVLRQLLPEEINISGLAGLITDDYSTNDGKVNWAVHHFYSSPLAATLTTLSKFQNDIRNAEFDIINTLYTNIKKDDFSFDTIAAKIVAPTNYVLQGEEYRADIFLAAYSTTQQPQITINGSTIPVSNGLGEYVVNTSTEGLHEYSGNIQLTAPNGSIKTYPFKSDYIVAKPSLVISPTKMNSFYIGPENPVSISIPGIPAEYIKASISGGNSLEQVRKGEFIVRLNKNTPAKVEISVSAQFPSGEVKNFGSMTFKAKRMPIPRVNIPNTISKEVFASYDKLGAIFDESFEFNLPLTITAFTLATSSGPYEQSETSNSNVITDKMKRGIKQTKTGSKIYIENVKAIDNVGNKYDLPSVSITIK